MIGHFAFFFFFNHWKTIIPVTCVVCKCFWVFLGFFGKSPAEPQEYRNMSVPLLLYLARSWNQSSCIFQRLKKPFSYNWEKWDATCTDKFPCHSPLPECPSLWLSLHPQQLCPAWSSSALEPGRGKSKSLVVATLACVLWNGNLGSTASIQWWDASKKREHAARGSLVQRTHLSQVAVRNS